jgi:hypothetical protein
LLELFGIIAAFCYEPVTPLYDLLFHVCLLIVRWHLGGCIAPASLLSTKDWMYVYAIHGSFETHEGLAFCLWIGEWRC